MILPCRVIAGYAGTCGCESATPSSISSLLPSFSVFACEFFSVVVVNTVVDHYCCVFCNVLEPYPHRSVQAATAAALEGLRGMLGLMTQQADHAGIVVEIDSLYIIP